jgi:3-hydroxyacyl-[acyl-carrier-protein] dehydratase
MQERAGLELTARSKKVRVAGAPETEFDIAPSDVLSLMPDGLRFLFLDEILEIDRTHISARCRFRENDVFYEGHFSDRAVTPGTVLLEAMCQCGVTAHSYYFLAQELGMAAAKRHRVLFTNCEAEWFELVAPGSVVRMRSELLAWRFRRIRARVTMYSEKNSVIAQSVLGGVSVSWHPADAGRSSGSLNNGENRKVSVSQGGVAHEPQ